MQSGLIGTEWSKWSYGTFVKAEVDFLLYWFSSNYCRNSYVRFATVFVRVHAAPSIRGFMSSAAWRAWHAIGSPRRLAAPMVDASDAAFRMLCREFGCDLAYTPMLNARLMVEEPAYRYRHFDPTGAEDRPMVAQFAGHDADTLVRAAELCTPHVDGVDLNLGCPQEIARKGRYGAFLIEDEPEIALECTRALCESTAPMVSVKMRLQPTRERTIDTALRLQECGIGALTVHGRNRLHTSRQLGIGPADWDAIGELVSLLDIPVIANGGIQSQSCVESCFKRTGAAAIMVAEALLENPALFSANRRPSISLELQGADVKAETRPTNDDALTSVYVDQNMLALRYLQQCERFPPRKGVAVVKAHLRRMLHAGWQQWPDLQDELYVASDIETASLVVHRLAARGWDQPGFHTISEHLSRSWYKRRLSAECWPDTVKSASDEDAHKAAWRTRYRAKSASKRHGAARKRLARELRSAG